MKIKEEIPILQEMVSLLYPVVATNYDIVEGFVTPLFREDHFSLKFKDEICLRHTF